MVGVVMTGMIVARVVVTRMIMVGVILSWHHHVGMIIANQPKITHFVSPFASKILGGFCGCSFAFEHCLHGGLISSVKLDHLSFC